MTTQSKTLPFRRPAEVDWQGIPPHHFIDRRPFEGVLRASKAMRDEAALRMKDFGGVFSKALRAIVAERYAACLRYGDGHPVTGKPWTIEDVPPEYREDD